MARDNERDLRCHSAYDDFGRWQDFVELSGVTGVGFARSFPGVRAEPRVGHEIADITGGSLCAPVHQYRYTMRPVEEPSLSRGYIPHLLGEESHLCGRRFTLCVAHIGDVG
jgi:hypothetical protein